MGYTLNFNGRVNEKSSRNFQIIDTTEQGLNRSIKLQCGKINENKFMLDFQFPFTPLQAFAVALSSLDFKLLCR